MNYGYTTLATDMSKKDLDSIGAKVLRAIFFFIPRSNPDHEKLYPQVAKWFLEVDKNGVPNREVGLDENDQPLFSAPNDRNFGFWTDGNKTFDEKELECSTKEEFETVWLIAKRKPNRM